MNYLQKQNLNRARILGSSKQPTGVKDVSPSTTKADKERTNRLSNSGEVNVNPRASSNAIGN